MRTTAKRKTVHISQLSILRMTCGNENKYSVVEIDGKFKEWVGIGGVRVNAVRWKWLQPVISGGGPLVLPNVWFGAQVNDQETANERIPHLLRCRAAVRFISCEPLLGPLDLTNIETDAIPRSTGFQKELRQTLTIEHGGIHWVSVGGEAGHNARPFVLGWGKDIVRQCKAVGVPVFVTQVGSNPTNREGERCPHIKDPNGRDVAEWPELLRVREYPQESVTV